MFELFAKQFRNPEGLLGKLAGKVMARDNQEINRWTIDRLHIQPGDQILEIGYGPGMAMAYMFKTYKRIRIDGVDISSQMAEEAGKRNAEFAEKGKLRLFQGEIYDAEQELSQYDKVISVNNYPLWKHKKRCLSVIHHVMKEGAVIAMTVQPREEDASKEKTFAHAREMERDLFQAGFRNISVKFRKFQPELTVCITAECRKSVR